MTVSKGKKLTAFRKLSGQSEHLLFIHDMQRVRSVQNCTAVLYEPANWCYIYINLLAAELFFLILAHPVYEI